MMKQKMSRIMNWAPAGNDSRLLVISEQNHVMKMIRCLGNLNQSLGSLGNGSALWTGKNMHCKKLL